VFNQNPEESLTLLLTVTNGKVGEECQIRLRVLDVGLVKPVTGGNPYCIFGSTSEILEDNNYLSGKTVYFGAGVIDGAHTATENTEAATVGLRNIALSVGNFKNVSVGTEDFHIQKTSSLRGVGIDLRSEGVTKDFEGDPRTVPFDIGADQIPSNTSTVILSCL